MKKTAEDQNWIEKERRNKNVGSRRPIPAFFKLRAIGFFALGLFVLLASIIWSVSVNWSMGTSIVWIAAVFFLLTAGAALHLLYIARKGLWFTMLLTCLRIENIKISRGLKNYFDPTSQTAFRQVQRIYFKAQDGTELTFDYDLGQKFVPNVKYLFYFRQPAEGEATIDMLDRLKINHEVHRQPAPVQ